MLFIVQKIQLFKSIFIFGARISSNEHLLLVKIFTVNHNYLSYYFLLSMVIQ